MGPECRAGMVTLSLHENTQKIKPGAVFFTEKSQTCPRIHPKSIPKPKTTRPPRPFQGDSLAADSVDRLHAGGVLHWHRLTGFVRQALHAAGVGGRGGQGEHELTPLALLALHTDLASGKVDQHLADIQAKTGPPGVQAAGPVLFVEALGSASGLMP